MKKKKSKKLSRRERIVVAEVTKGRSVTKAGRKAWPNAKPESARVLASKALQKDTVQSAIAKAYEKHGLTEEYFAQKTWELCEASDKILFQGVAIKGANEPNWTARAKGLEIAHKVRGDYKEKIEIEGLGEVIKKLDDAMLDARIEELLNKRKK